MPFFRSNNSSVSTFSSLSPLFKSETKESTSMPRESGIDALARLRGQVGSPEVQAYTVSTSSKSTKAAKKEKKQLKEQVRKESGLEALERLRRSHGSPMVQANYI